MVRDPARTPRLTNQDLIAIFSDEAHVLRLRTGEVLFKIGDPSVEALMPRSAMVYALTEAEIVEIDKERLLSLVEEVPGFALAVMRVLSRRLRRMDVRYDAKRPAELDGCRARKTG
jgi:CRP-like cAMP-binding protein